MLKSDKRTSAVRSHGVRVVALLGTAVLMVSSTVFGGLLDDGVRGAPPVARADGVAVTAATTSDYQLRCWQYGRLIFDERNLDAPPAGMRSALVMSSADGQSTLQVMDVGGTTCLVTPGGARTEAPPRR